MQVLVPKYIFRKAVLDFSADDEEGPTEEKFELLRCYYQLEGETNSRTALLDIMDDLQLVGSLGQ